MADEWLGIASLIVLTVCGFAIWRVFEWGIPRGAFIRMGLAVELVALMPVMWQALFTNSGAKGFHLLAILLLPIGAGLILVGLTAALARGIRGLWTADS